MKSHKPVSSSFTLSSLAHGFPEYFRFALKRLRSAHKVMWNGISDYMVSHHVMACPINHSSSSMQICSRRNWGVRLGSSTTVPGLRLVDFQLPLWYAALHLNCLSHFVLVWLLVPVLSLSCLRVFTHFSGSTVRSLLIKFLKFAILTADDD